MDNFEKFLNNIIGHDNVTNQVSGFINKNVFLDINKNAVLDIKAAIIRHLIVDNASITSFSSDPEELKRVDNLRKDIKVLRNIFKKSSLDSFTENRGDLFQRYERIVSELIELDAMSGIFSDVPGLKKQIENLRLLELEISVD
jgi:hypothetical protein